jgi:hypoxanthine phosphoribosyltransferase
MKVIDLLNGDLENACIRLSKQIDRQFDLVIGIAEGGRFVAECLAKELNLPILFVKKQRPFTEKKRKLGKILPFFPQFLKNMFRIMEGIFYEWSFDGKWKDESKNVVFVSQHVDVLYAPEIQNVLLVDDSIDRGATVKDCMQFLLNCRNDLSIHVAVLTQTFKRPLYDADYKLYSSVLIRYPWSSDVKEK